MSNAPFIGDADEIAAAWRALSEGETRRAVGYRQWAAEARTEPEREHWTAEAESQEAGARWHADKARQWMEDANG